MKGGKPPADATSAVLFSVSLATKVSGAEPSADAMLDLLTVANVGERASLVRHADTATAGEEPVAFINSQLELTLEAMKEVNQTIIHPAMACNQAELVALSETRSSYNQDAARQCDGPKKRILRSAALLPQRLLLLLVLAQCLCGTRANELADVNDDKPVRNPSPDDVFHDGLQSVALPPPLPSASPEANLHEPTTLRRELQSSYIFTSRAALYTARDAWCSDPTSAEATYGVINTWDVSRITDMYCLFSPSSWCSSRGGNGACANRSPQIGSWDVSNVTTMGVSDRLSLAHLHPPSLRPLHPNHLTLRLSSACTIGRLDYVPRCEGLQ